MENNNITARLVCLMIFSSVMLLPDTVGGAWSCLGAQEYHFSLKNYFGEAFKQQHATGYIDIYCEPTELDPFPFPTLSSEGHQKKNVSFFVSADFDMCAGWFQDVPPYNCGAAFLPTGSLLTPSPSRWSTGKFPVLHQEYDCAKNHKYCEVHLHDDHVLVNSSPEKNIWIRYELNI
ncbi:hypothetical protein C1H46_027047 [Malus baccata]|uniref:Wall-associated receptor kinase galacturonan-binding domain-containing protein n=1 Tax=Malus baccata TaxID=106549 RepID=A0A540LLN0_MALBA|nr:hypothetical protein C1H46_027047 [Malus baccata]